MADVALRGPRHASWANAGAVVAALLALGIVLQVFEPGRVAGIQNFLLVFSSLLIEAVPFVLLGAVVSATIEVFVPSRVFEKLTALPGPLQLPAAAMTGFAFPVCECGSVPVARRLAAKGLSPAAAVTFMLAAPILNPVVIASTFVAYRGRDSLWPMVLGRAGLGLVAAVAIGWVVSNKTKAELLRPRAGDDAHDHSNGSRADAFFAHLSGDFLFMGRYLVLGAVVAAALQTFVPQSVIGSVAGTPVVDLIAMMALAFVLSLCSESDAFVAASFVQFGVGAQLAFLVFGPMVDTKLGFLYSATFTRGFFRTVVIGVAAVTLAGTLWIEVLIG
ncbi:MAG TPA: permease [Actinomycetota bacterium]|nr:permease [Actinomycetota bacterium]